MWLSIIIIITLASIIIINMTLLLFHPCTFLMYAEANVVHHLLTSDSPTLMIMDHHHPHDHHDHDEDYRTPAQISRDEILLLECVNYYDHHHHRHDTHAINTCIDMEERRLAHNRDMYRRATTPATTITTTTKATTSSVSVHDRISSQQKAVGYQTITLAEDTYESIYHNVWQVNKHEWIVETWPAGDTTVNHWKSPTYRVDLIGGRTTTKETSSSSSSSSSSLRRRRSASTTTTTTTTTNAATSLVDIAQLVQDAISQQVPGSSSLKLAATPQSIRIYTRDATIQSSAMDDRLPNVVATAILNVAMSSFSSSSSSSTASSWPMEIMGHDGVFRNVTINPGQLLLIDRLDNTDDTSLILGAPYALQSDYAAFMTFHFERSVDDDGDDENHIADFFDNKNVDTSKAIEESSMSSSLEDMIHMYAQQGDIDQLQSILSIDSELAHLQDANGWTPLHEAARGGHFEVVQLLVNDYGADFNLRTQHGMGGTPLYYATKYMEMNNDDNSNNDYAMVIQSLQDLGAIIVAPGEYASNDLDNVMALFYAAHEGRIDEVSQRLGISDIHTSSSSGNADGVGGGLRKPDRKRLSSLLSAADSQPSQWTVLQYAVRSGYIDLVSMLIQYGANIHYRINRGYGASTLYLAELYHGSSHPVSQLLSSHGAVSVPPVLQLQ
jgi:ankyrin repeat protein